LLIRALAEAPARHIRAVVAGEGECRTALQELAAALGVSNRVLLPGRLSEEDLLDYLAECRAVCFPTLAEDYGFVTVEAFASRKAVVTCIDSGGPAELVCDGTTGLVCEPNAGAVASALARLMDDAAFAERLGSAAAVWVGQLTWPATLARLLAGHL